jgi:hypothetical protein
MIGSVHRSRDAIFGGALDNQVIKPVIETDQPPQQSIAGPQIDDSTGQPLPSESVEAQLEEIQKVREMYRKQEYNNLMKNIYRV